MNDQEVVDKMEAVWRSIASLCETLGEGEWKTPTDCPGWSVQDQLSHLVGRESRPLGRPPPEHVPQDVSHVKNEIGQRNEVLVDWRRPWPGAKLLEEFQEVTGQRLKVLRAMSADDFAAETQTPIGPGSVRDLLEIRILDAWVHEQDMRRAVGRPGHMEGPVVEHAIGRMATAMPYVVGRKAQSPDGASVVFDLTGPAGRVLAITVEGTRARPMEAAPASPTLRLTMDVETFACLACGRWEPGGVLDSGRVQIAGDQGLGKAVVEQMNFMV